MTRPRTGISVIIPVYNLEAYIGRALESVRTQDPAALEVLVVDDGSTDGTLAEVRRAERGFPATALRVLRTPHVGPGAARNRALEAARGAWIAFLDGDDVWLPGKLKAVEDAIRRDPGVGIVAHEALSVNTDGLEAREFLARRFDPRRKLLPQLYRGNFLTTSCVVVRTEALRAAGGFHCGIKYGEDYHLWLTLSLSERLSFLPAALAKHFDRSEGLSANLPERRRGNVEVIFRFAGDLRRSEGFLCAYRLRLWRTLACNAVCLKKSIAARDVRSFFRHLGEIGGDVLRALVAPVS